MLIYEYKLDGNTVQYAAIEEAVRITQFIRNKCVRKWMDGRGISRNDLQCYCAELAQEYSFAARLNSQARQVAADRAWHGIARFYENCKNHKPGKKGYPRFQHDNRSVEYKQTGWKLEPDGRHITFYTDSDGTTVENPRHYRKAEKKLKRLHRRLSKKQKNSNNRKKARKQLAKGYLKVQRQREDFARKCANALVTSHDLIAYEDLKIANMVRNRKLAKSIHDAGWGAFIRKVQAYGVMHSISVIAVPPQYTSADCSECGTRVKKTLSMRTHICTGCGVVLDRDHNAACNILAKALDFFDGTAGHAGTGTLTGV